jgi:hypothetical protein
MHCVFLRHRDRLFKAVQENGAVYYEIHNYIVLTKCSLFLLQPLVGTVTTVVVSIQL